MIPVTCYKLQGFSFSYKRYGRILHATTLYRVRKILYPNLYTESPEK